MLSDDTLVLLFREIIVCILHIIGEKRIYVAGKIDPILRMDGCLPTTRTTFIIQGHICQVNF